MNDFGSSRGRRPRSETTAKRGPKGRGAAATARTPSGTIEFVRGRGEARCGVRIRYHEVDADTLVLRLEAIGPLERTNHKREPKSRRPKRERSKAMGEADKRASGRSELEVTVDLESDHNFYTGLTQNISTGGLFVATHRLRKVGDRVAVTFTLPNDAKPVSVDTEVRWIRETTSLSRPDGPTGMGLRFINLPPEASAAIGRFLPVRDSLYYDDE